MFGLNMVDVKRPTIADERRKSPRDVVLQGIGHQLGLLRDAAYTFESQRYRRSENGYHRATVRQAPKPWFWSGTDGAMYAQVRYGSSQVVHLDGKPTIQCGKDAASVIKAFEIVAKAVQDGKLDAEIAAAHSKTRRNKKSE